MVVQLFSVLIWLTVATPCLADKAATQDQLSQDEQSYQDPIPIKPPSGQVPKHLLLISNTEVSAPYAFVADKANRTLTLWEQKDKIPVMVDAFPMDMGRSEGDKAHLGDHKTPEGIYFFQNKLEGSGLNFKEYGIRAFPLDYPNFFDRLLGKTGSGIWLHSIPDSTSLRRGSRGCVVVRIDIIEKITPFINLKRTPIVILDKVDYVTPNALTNERTRIMTWLEKWRATWESKDINGYIANYHDDFHAMRMGREQWREYKGALNDKYGFIKVKMEKPSVLQRREDIVIRFLQDYESDGLKDFGEKTLYVRQTDNGMKIISEEWQPINIDLVAHKNEASARKAE